MLRDEQLKYPLIQGGMGVGISLSSLAGHVARCGCMGTLSAADIGFREEDFLKTPQACNDRALKREIENAKAIANGNGLIAVNIMVATSDYDHVVEKAIEYGVDAIVSGAGLPLNLAALNRGRVMIAPIVSSVRALNIILKRWKKVDTLPDFIVVEGPLAGGHLGFKSLEGVELMSICEEVINFLRSKDLSIKVIAAGGIRTPEEVKALKAIGVYGVQVATPFIATYECDADPQFKEAIINGCDDDLEIIHSPVGMPARAIQNAFIDHLALGAIKKRTMNCINCIKPCDGVSMAFCISEYLIKSCKGEEGLVFSGASIEGIRSMRHVEDVIGDYFQ